MIARDTIIHHYGSQSMRALGEQFHVVNRRNEQFFIPAMRWHLQERAHTVWTQEDLVYIPKDFRLLLHPCFAIPNYSLGTGRMLSSTVHLSAYAVKG